MWDNLIAYFAVFVVFCWTIYEKWLKKYIGSDNRNKYFAEFFKDFPILFNQKTTAQKSRIFKALESKGKNDITILEIGIGSGGNFQFYPETTTCHLIANDPNAYFHPIFKENLKKFPHIILEKISSCSADNLLDIPDNSVDVVVSTLVLCSVPNLSKTLDEIRRVLKPGGKFIYMEHVIDPEAGFWRTLQKIIDLFGIWEFLFDGCHASRPSGVVIKNTGFKSVVEENFYLDPSGFWGLWVVKPFICGVCTK